MEEKFSHYFVDDDTKEYKTYLNIFNYKGVDFRYKTQDGVFSKKQIDEGSLFLVDCAIKENLHGKGLDLGCGYGAISMLLCKNCDVEMTACDINSRAVNLANENFKSNNCKARAVVSNVAENINFCDYDFVISNPPIRVGNAILFNFFVDAHKKLREGGEFFAVLRKKQGAETYAKKIASIFGNCEVVDKHKGYVVVKATKNGENI